MTLVLMIIGTLAWFWKGYVEFGLCMMIWAIWIENISASSAILSRLIPSEESLKKAQEIINSLKKARE